MIVYGRSTRGVIEAVVLYLSSTFIVLGLGIVTQNMPGNLLCSSGTNCGLYCSDRLVMAPQPADQDFR